MPSDGPRQADREGTPAPRRLKICHIITRLIVGGAQENTIFSCARLDPARYETLLVAGPETGPEGDLQDEARRLGVRLVRVEPLVREPRPRRDAAALAALWRVLRRERPDLVHTHSSKAGALGRTAAWLAGVPAVHTVHGWSFHDYMPWAARRLYVSAERVLARRTQRLIVVSRRDRDKGLRAGIGRASQYVLVRSGVDLGTFRADPAGGAAVRAALGLPAGARVVGAVTRLTEQKDPRTLLRVAARVIPERADVYFVLAGDGPLRRELEETAATLGLGARIRFLGICRDVPALMTAFDVLVACSLWEGLPRVVPEAMAVGVPVVAAGVDGVPEAIEDGVSGLLAPPGDVTGLADRLLRILSDADLARRLAGSARDRVQEFDLSLMIAQLDGVYRDVLAAREPGRARAAARPGLGAPRLDR
jgi:glycosyltransferase involved in cell wall biosynthesis